MNCPACGLALEAAQIDDAPVSYCGQCHGFLTNTEVFRAIITKRRSHHRPDEKCTAPLNSAELQRVVMCPNCAQRMDTHPYFGGGNVVVDTCERCNLIWLDLAKLALIERYVPYAHQIERTLTLRGGRYQGGPSDTPSLGYFLDDYWPGRERR